MAAWVPLTPDEARRVLAGLAVPWWIAGGWALDLHAGVTHPHGDLDVSVLRRDAAAVRRHLGAWDLHVADPPGTLVPWDGEGPGHDVWARRAPGEPWAFQLVLEESDDDDWVYRRDPRVRRPLASLGEHVLAPEVQLLYRVDSGADVTEWLPTLRPEARAWLDAALTTRRSPP